MRKLLCLFALLALTCCITVVSCAENSVAKYTDILVGKWKRIGFFCEPNDDNAFYYGSDIYFGLGKTECRNPGAMDASWDLERNTKTALVGDETGAVFVILSIEGEQLTAGQVHVSDDQEVLLITTSDGGQFIYKKQYSDIGWMTDDLTFGRYPQTADGTDATPIEWKVLSVQGNRALLLSRYGLDEMPYHTERIDITWEQCTLRTWLNQDFLNKAFSETERNAILTSYVDNDQGYWWETDGGKDTEDKIFLLSYEEANEYLGVTEEDKDNMESRTAPTAYAIRNGAYTSDSWTTEDGNLAGMWWLRSPGDLQSEAADVRTAGSLSNRSVNDSSVVVRPAMWVNLESEIFKSLFE